MAVRLYIVTIIHIELCHYIIYKLFAIRGIVITSWDHGSTVKRNIYSIFGKSCAYRYYITLTNIRKYARKLTKGTHMQYSPYMHAYLAYLVIFIARKDCLIMSIHFTTLKVH